MTKFFHADAKVRRFLAVRAAAACGMLVRPRDGEDKCAPRIGFIAQVRS